MSKRINVGNTNMAILNGETDLSVWDEEKLRRGRRRNRNGGWVGKPPKIVPKVIHDELVRRQYDKAAGILRDSLVMRWCCSGRSSTTTRPTRHEQLIADFMQSRFPVAAPWDDRHDVPKFHRTR